MNIVEKMLAAAYCSKSVDFHGYKYPQYLSITCKRPPLTRRPLAICHFLGALTRRDPLFIMLHIKQKEVGGFEKQHHRQRTPFIE